MAHSYRLGMKRPDCYSYISTNINEASASCIIKQVIVGVAVKKKMEVYNICMYGNPETRHSKFNTSYCWMRGVVSHSEQGAEGPDITPDVRVVHLKLPLWPLAPAGPTLPTSGTKGNPGPVTGHSPHLLQGRGAKSAPPFQRHIIY